MSTLVAGIDSSTQSCKVVIREAGSGALAREDAKGTFGARIAARRPDVVIDLICFTAASARQLVDARRGELKVHQHALILLHRALRAGSVM
jgi:hypothetical protein